MKEEEGQDERKGEDSRVVGGLGSIVNDVGELSGLGLEAQKRVEDELEPRSRR